MSLLQFARVRKRDTTREITVEQYLVRACARLRVRAVKMRDPGWPDRMLLWHDGIVDFVETKRPQGGRYQPRQLLIHSELRKIGYTVVVLRTKAEVDEYLMRRTNLGTHNKVHGTNNGTANARRPKRVPA